MNLVYFLIPVLLLLISPLVKVEILNYNEFYYQCDELREANIELLTSKHCQRMDKRLKHKNAGTVDCERAEMEIKRKVWECALKRWWQQFELVQLYHRVLGSYWRVLPLIVCCMYFIYKYISNRNSELRMYDRMERIADKLTTTTYPTIQREILRLPSSSKQYQGKEYDNSPLMEVD